MVLFAHAEYQNSKYTGKNIKLVLGLLKSGLEVGEVVQQVEHLPYMWLVPFRLIHESGQNTQGQGTTEFIYHFP